MHVVENINAFRSKEEFELWLSKKKNEDGKTKTLEKKNKGKCSILISGNL